MSEQADYKRYHKQARKIISKHLGRDLSIFELVHHIDHNWKNNKVSNLMLVTPEQHASLHGGSKKKGHINPNKTSKVVIDKIMSLHQEGKNYSQISKIIGLSDQTVRNYIINFWSGNQG